MTKMQNLEDLLHFETGWSLKHPEWRGLSRRIADGARDKTKQRGFYIGITDEGHLSTIPKEITAQMAGVELVGAKQLYELANDAANKCVLASREYRYI